MHRLMAIAAILFLAASLPLAAQHGGGHASAGGHGGGFAAHGSFSGHSSVGRSFSGAHSTSSFAPRSYARGSFNASRGLASRNFGGFRGRGFRDFGFRNCYGYRCGGAYGYPWLYGGIDPYWWWDSDSSYDQDQQYQIGLANEMNAESLDEQRMREQADQYSYAPYASASAASSPRSRDSRTSDPRAADKPEAVSPTVLVFRDQHKEEVQNYAIVGQTLWNFAPQHTQKIPLSDLDLPATEKANEDRGVSFRVPGANEGQ
ncbi:MAG: hypothetical protein WBV69_04470 [Candidatus Sulfotelmatobacter sp.]